MSKKIISLRYLALVLSLIFCSATYAQISVTREAYLQQGTPNSVVVCWRTDQVTDSKVWFGTQLGNLNQTVEQAGSRVDHQLKIEGLQPNTIYYYAYGNASGIIGGDDAQHFVLTAPLTGSEKPTRIWVLGDAGTSGDPDNKPPNPPNDPGLGQRMVRDAYYNYTGSRHTDLWLMLGDNAYQDGTDSEYQAAVFDIYTEMLKKSVLWPTIGNHDAESANSGNQSGPYYDLFMLPAQAEAGGLASGTEAYYSFDYANIHFISIDSQDSPRETNGPMLTWLQQDLAATTQEWIIVYWHHPPYSKGSHDSDEPRDSRGRLKDMRKNALPILDQFGVDLVLSGHSHSYERSFLLHGHYNGSDSLENSMIIDGGDGRPAGDGSYQKDASGSNPMQGTVYAVAGCGGRLSDGADLDHPVMIHAAMEELGSMVIDIEGLQLKARFVNETGAVLDSFEIVHQALTEIDPAGSVSVANGIKLLPNYPNPFNPETVIPIEITAGFNATSVKLQIFDILGRQLRQLSLDQFSAGQHLVKWDGRDQSGQTVSSGTYFYQLRIDQPGRTAFTDTHRMILTR